MEENKTGKVVLLFVCGRRVAFLNREVREVITGKVTFDQRPEGGAGITHADIWGDSKCQVLGVEACFVDQQRGQGGPVK